MITIELMTGFIILAALGCYIFIHSKLNPVVKAILIPIIIWYGFSMYYTPLNLMGTPRPVKTLPDKAIIINFKINEPERMYFWFYHKPEFSSRINPKDAFKKIKATEPQSCAIPYDRKLHEQLLSKAEQRRRTGGILIWERHETTRSSAVHTQEKPGEFKVIDPVDILPPK